MGIAKLEVVGLSGRTTFVDAPAGGVIVHAVRVHATAPSGVVRVTEYASCGSSMRWIVSSASTPPEAAESMTTSP